MNTNLSFIGISHQVAGYCALRLSGLFYLLIPLRYARHAPDFAFRIGVSQHNG
jgi:hypothetical protein